MTNTARFADVIKPVHGHGINELSSFLGHPNIVVASTHAVGHIILALYNENEEWDSSTIENVAQALENQGFPSWLWDNADLDDDEITHPEIQQVAELMSNGKFAEARLRMMSITQYMTEENEAAAHQLVFAELLTYPDQEE